MISKLYVLQSLASSDTVRSGRMLADRMEPILPVSFADVPDVSALTEELRKIKDDLMSLSAPAVIHFDCHGDKDGIALFNEKDQQTDLDWEDFRITFRDIYVSVPVKPLISFSSCCGLHVFRLIAKFEPSPFEAIAGCLIDIGFEESVDAFFLFYTELHKDTRLVDAVEKVSLQFPDLKFLAAPATVLAQLGWIKYRQTKLTPDLIRKRKEEIIKEIISIQGSIKPHQRAMLDKLLTPDSGGRDEQRHRKIFNS